MPKTIIPTSKTGFMIIFTPEEMNEIQELSIIRNASIQSMIEACFIIGSKLMAESLDPSNPLA